MSQDLVEYLKERLREEEAHAVKDLALLDRASNGGAWKVLFGYNLRYSEIKAGGVVIGHMTGTYGRALADGERDQHCADALVLGRMVNLARDRASAVLADIEAKRRLVGEFERELADDSSNETVHFYLLTLVQPYSSRPDFNPEWRTP